MGTSIRRRLLAAIAVAISLAAVTPAAAQTPQDVVVAPGTISSATTMTLVPDGRIFVAQQNGALRVIKNGALLSTPFLTVPVTSTDERGLLGVTLDPNFATNRFVYVYYTASSPVVNRVSRFRASAANPDVAEAGSETIIFNRHPVAVRLPQRRRAPVRARRQALLRGRRERTTSSNAQSTEHAPGKMLRINADGTIPADNPFFSDGERARTGRSGRSACATRSRSTSSRRPGGSSSTTSGQHLGGDQRGLGRPGAAGRTTAGRRPRGRRATRASSTPFYAYNHAGGHCAITGGAFYNPATAQLPGRVRQRLLLRRLLQGWIKSVDLATSGRRRFAAEHVASPVDIDVAADGSLYYLARGPGNVHRVRFADAARAAVDQHPSAAGTVPVGRNATFTVVGFRHRAAVVPVAARRGRHPGRDVVEVHVVATRSSVTTGRASGSSSPTARARPRATRRR